MTNDTENTDERNQIGEKHTTTGAQWQRMETSRLQLLPRNEFTPELHDLSLLAPFTVSQTANVPSPNKQAPRHSTCVSLTLFVPPATLRKRQYPSLQNPPRARRGNDFVIPGHRVSNVKSDLELVSWGVEGKVA